VVAPQGTAFTENQARILKRFVSEVVLCFDADAAGQKAAERSLDALLQNNLVVRVAEMPAGEDPDSMVRKRGREEFEKRVATARDFFDWWIERETSATDLDSLGAKMQLARTLAETIARVQDPLMRGEVANRASARIGVARTDFERLLAKPNRERFSFEDAAPRREIMPAPRHEIGMLCLLALRHEEARDFLQAQEWREMLSHTPDAELLGRILASDLRPEEPASLNAFMASLAPGEEALVSSWLLQRMPPNGLEVAQGWWNGLRQASLRRQLQIAEGRMKLPRLTTGEAVNLQKQILDLTEQLRELSTFSSARVLDN
jgi:DNA primase